MMYDYTIARTADRDAFKSQCAAIEAIDNNESGVHISSIRRLDDVDGSAIQIYKIDSVDEVKVYLDTEVDAVYIKSTCPIDNLLISKA